MSKDKVQQAEALGEGFKWEKGASKEDVAVLYADHKQVDALHRAILDKIHLTQIAASGFSNSECLEWIQERLEKL